MRPNWKRVLLGALLLVAAVLIMDVGCVFRKTTGVPCPGCGMTRAHLAALRLDFKDAFFYHPLWFLPAPLAAAELFFQGSGLVLVDLAAQSMDRDAHRRYLTKGAIFFSFSGGNGRISKNGKGS